MDETNKITIKEILYTIITYIVLYIISFGVFILLIRLPIFKSIEVLMYRGIILIVISGILASILLVLYKDFRKAKWLSIKDAILIFIVTCSINIVFFTLIPVTVERSISVFMLSYIDNNSDKSFTQEEISNIFIDKYVNEYEAFDKRFNEQLVTGSIEQNEDGTYSITNKGQFIVKLFKVISEIFETDSRIINSR